MPKGRGRPATIEGAWNGLIKALMATQRKLETFQERYTGNEDIELARISQVMRIAGRGKSYFILPEMILHAATSGGLSELLIKKDAKQ